MSSISTSLFAVEESYSVLMSAASQIMGNLGLTLQECNSLSGSLNDLLENLNSKRIALTLAGENLKAKLSRDRDYVDLLASDLRVEPNNEYNIRTMNAYTQNADSLERVYFNIINTVDNLARACVYIKERAEGIDAIRQSMLSECENIRLLLSNKLYALGGIKKAVEGYISAPKFSV